tara:strand:+ start:1250 stop:1894 length:645 start_codon:yes stop_codon:yes gene_type:complete
MVLPLLLLIGVLIIAYVVYIAVIYWYITLPIIGFIVFVLHSGRIGKWIGKKRYERHIAVETKKREKQAKIILEQKRLEDIKLKQLQIEKEKKFWRGISKQFEDVQNELPALPDYTIKHKPKPRVTKRTRPSSLQEAMSALQNRSKQKTSLDLDKCYKILGLKKNASLLQIQLRFKELALKHHPDRNLNSKFAVKKFAEITQARKIILQTIEVAI